MLPRLPRLDFSTVEVDQTDSSRSSSVRPINREGQLFKSLALKRTLINYEEESGLKSERIQNLNTVSVPNVQQLSSSNQLGCTFVSSEKSPRVAKANLRDLGHRQPLNLSSSINFNQTNVSHTQDTISKYKDSSPRQSPNKRRNLRVTSLNVSLPNIQSVGGKQFPEASVEELPLKDRILQSEQRWNTYNTIKLNSQLHQVHQAVTVKPNLDLFRLNAENKLNFVFRNPEQTEQKHSRKYHSSLSPCKNIQEQKDCNSQKSSDEDYWKDLPSTQPLKPAHQALTQLKSYTDGALKDLKPGCMQHFDQLCDSLLDPRKEIAPLLQHYDTLEKFSDLLLPSEKMLRLDQDFFRKYIERLKLAHKYEMRIAKQQIQQAAEEFISTEVNRLQRIVKEDFLKFAESQEKQRQYSKGQQTEIERLTRLLTQCELHMQEMQVYVRTLNKNLVKESFQIQLVNQGKDIVESQEYILHNDGKIIKDSDMGIQMGQLDEDKHARMLQVQHNYLNMIELGKFDIVQQKINQEQPNKKCVTLPATPEPIQREIILSDESLRIDNLLSPINRSQTNTSVITTLNLNQFELVSAHESEAPQLHPVKDPSDGLYVGSFAQTRGRVENIVWLQNQVEPILSEPFQFYGSHLSVTLHDRFSILQNELFMYYQGLLAKEKLKCGVDKDQQNYLLSEFKDMQEKFLEYRDANQLLRDELVRMKEKYERDTDLMTSLVHAEARKRIRNMYKLFEQQRQWFNIEIRVLEEIAQRAIATAHQKTEQLRKMEFLMKVPRLRDEYLAQNGVDPFILRFTSVVAEHQAVIEEKKRIEELAKHRHDVSIFKHVAVARQPEILSQIGVPISTELIIRKTFKKIKDKINSLERSQDTNKIVSSNTSLESLVLEAQNCRSQQKHVPFKPTPRAQNHVEAVIPRAINTYEETKQSFMDQYKIQFLNVNANKNRAPTGSNFKTSNQSLLNKSVDLVLLDAQQDQFLHRHQQRLMRQKKGNDTRDLHQLSIKALGKDMSLATPHLTADCSYGSDQQLQSQADIVSSVSSKNISIVIEPPRNAKTRQINMQGLLRQSASQEIMLKYQIPTSISLDSR